MPIVKVDQSKEFDKLDKLIKENSPENKTVLIHLTSSETILPSPMKKRNEKREKYFFLIKNWN